jgi:hypothetical protein
MDEYIGQNQGNSITMSKKVKCPCCALYAKYDRFGFSLAASNLPSIIHWSEKTKAWCCNLCGASWDPIMKPIMKKTRLVTKEVAAAWILSR